MNAPIDSVTSETPNTRRLNRWVMLLLVLMFVAPWVAAMLWQPSSYINNGDLIEPARPLADIDIATIDGKPLSLQDLNAKWSLVYFSTDCPRRCEEVLYTMRQVRLAQSKNAKRVRSVLIVSEPDNARARLQSLAGVMVLTASPAGLREIVQVFTLPEGDPFTSKRVYLVDPLGNLMMSFSSDIDPSKMRKDLVRLLKVSQVG